MYFFLRLFRENQYILANETETNHPLSRGWVPKSICKYRLVYVWMSVGKLSANVNNSKTRKIILHRRRGESIIYSD